MPVTATWFETKPGSSLAEVDLDRFAIDLKVAEGVEKIRVAMTERSGRMITVEEIVKIQLASFLFENRAFLFSSGEAKPVAKPPALPDGEDRLARKAREIFLGMIPG